MAIRDVSARVPQANRDDPGGGRATEGDMTGAVMPRHTCSAARLALRGPRPGREPAGPRRMSSLAFARNGKQAANRVWLCPRLHVATLQYVHAAYSSTPCCRDWMRLRIHSSSFQAHSYSGLSLSISRLSLSPSRPLSFSSLALRCVCTLCDGYVYVHVCCPHSCMCVDVHVYRQSSRDSDTSHASAAPRL